ncbi:hypothetical protein CCB81_11135 [Armatimonadetes bacterium Uphvl-Ar2]|nr:hypothetical protein CCB81_11135 [Armatimonadetes bacterium Uphvl-Ar2]
MWFLAVNSAFLTTVALATPVTPVAPPTSTQANVAYAQFARAVEQSGRTRGFAVLITSDGRWLAPDIDAEGPAPVLLLRDGRRMSTRVLANDEITRLALIFGPTDGATVISEAGTLRDGQTVWAISAQDVHRGMVVGEDKVGIDEDTRRYLPLREYRFENLSLVGSMPVLDQEGRLCGFLSASLAIDSSSANMVRSGQFGPGGIAVSYSINPTVLRRVVSGFRMAEPRVNHPTIGAFWRNYPAGEGALVTQVLPESPAAQAGLQAGFVILSIDGEPVDNAVKLATMLFNMSVGDTVNMTVRDLDRTFTIQLKVGANAKPEASAQASETR